jgi:hypothetical protein
VAEEELEAGVSEQHLGDGWYSWHVPKSEKAHFFTGLSIFHEQIRLKRYAQSLYAFAFSILSMKYSRQLSGKAST